MFIWILASLKAPRAKPTEAFSNLLPNPRPSLESRMKALLRLFPIAIIAGFLVMSCAPVPTDGSASPPTSIPTSPPSNCHPPSLENCYTAAQMKDYLDNVAIPYVDQFSQDSYAHMPLPNYVYIPEGQTYNSNCGAVEESAFAYCPSNDTVYIGQKTEWWLYQNYGAIAPVLGLAHEFGHHIQSKVGVPEPPTNSPEEVNHENQADCIAGAWVLWADQVKHIIEYPKDLQNIDGLMTAIADKENRTHGTASERVRSFELGHSSGLSACNSYYPDYPILHQMVN